MGKAKLFLRFQEDGRQGFGQESLENRPFGDEDARDAFDLAQSGNGAVARLPGDEATHVAADLLRRRDGVERDRRQGDVVVLGDDQSRITPAE